MGNTFGRIFTLTTFGESHGKAIGGVVDGMPPGVEIDTRFIQAELNRRRPGQSQLTTSRAEADEIEFLSGIFENKSTGTPIAFLVRNNDAMAEDYDALRHVLRPSHADFTYQYKYGIRDYRGGGRASARTTISRCVGGALAKLALRQTGITIQAYTSQIGNICLERDYRQYDLSAVEQNEVRCPDKEKALMMEELIKDMKKEGDSIGGVITCVIKGCPPGIGEPEFGKLHAALAHAMMSINAAKGFEYGEGFNAGRLKGSEQNDAFACKDKRITTQTNHSGGIQGGISNGEDIYFRVAFKAAPTITKPQETIDTERNPVTLKATGRHDPCVVPRAIPIVEAMAAMTILDFYLLSKLVK